MNIRWIKLHVTGETKIPVINVEIWPEEAPPSPTAPGAIGSSYYVNGETAAGVPLPIGPGFLLCRGAYYAPTGSLAYAPPGVVAAERID